MGVSADQTLSPDQETSFGRQIIRQMRAEGIILEDPQVTEYLQSLGQRLASHAGVPGQRFNFYLIDSADVNAFALPGGYIGINAGLIMMTENESELAGVMAHEVAHVTQRHIARKLEQSARTGMATTLGVLAALVIAATTGQTAIAEAGMAAGTALQIQSFINYTRAHEYEADRIGIGILADAGFDPAGMVSMFEQMDRRARLSGSRLPEFLSTHPVSSARITEARDRAATYQISNPQESRIYGLMRARARALATPANHAYEYFVETLKSAPEAKHQELRYGEALALTGLGRAAEAIAILEPMADKQDDSVYLQLALAQAEFSNLATNKAMRRYERALRIFPRNLAVVDAYARALLSTNRGREAIPHLIGLLPRSEPEPEIYRMLAMASGSVGETADAHYFMSEVHVLNGQLFPAIDQLQLTLATPGINTQQRARAEARLEQLSAYLPRNQRVRLDQPLPTEQDIQR